MSLSSLLLTIWVALVSVWVRGWTADHAWLPWAIFVVGVIFVIVRLLELLGVISWTWTRTRPARPADPVV